MSRTRWFKGRLVVKRIEPGQTFRTITPESVYRYIHMLMHMCVYIHMILHVVCIHMGINHMVLGDYL